MVGDKVATAQNPPLRFTSYIPGCTRVLTRTQYTTFNVNTAVFGLVTGSTRYGPVDYSGTIYVKDSEGSDYLGVVFGYQSNRKFYVVMWRRENINFANGDINTGIKGLQLKVRILDRIKETVFR